MGAAAFVDILWPVFVLFGIEAVRIDPGNTAMTPMDFVSYPWTHSLLMALAWGAAFGLAWRAATDDGRGAWVVAALVPSHWVLDVVSHRPDLPLVPGAGPRLGLGLWNSIPAAGRGRGALRGRARRLPRDDARGQPQGLHRPVGLRGLPPRRLPRQLEAGAS